MINSDNTHTNKIVFFMPRKGPVIGEFLVYPMLADYISKNSSYETCCIFSGSPVLSEDYKDSKFKMLDYNTFDNYDSLAGAIFVVPVNYLAILLFKIKELKNSKLVLLAMHPSIFGYFFSQFIYRKGIREQILKLFSQHDALGFMDEVNMKGEIADSDLEFKPQYVPVPYSWDATYEFTLKPVNERIDVGWLGRLDADKIYSVINLIENLYNSHYNINLHIIGDGNARSRISLSKYAPQINFIFTSYLFGDDLKKYLSDNIDLLVAPGQSGLLGASLHIPVIIPCMSDRVFYSDKYVYLFDSENYSLGWNVRTLNELGYESKGITYFLEQILLPGNKEVLGSRCFDYMVESHSISHSSECFLSLIKQTTLTVEDCMTCYPIKRHFLEFDLYERLFHKDYLEYIKLTPRINNHLKKGLWHSFKKFTKVFINKSLILLKKIVKSLFLILKKFGTYFERIKSYHKVQGSYKSKVKYVKNQLEMNGKLKVAFLVVFDSVFPSRPVFEEMLDMSIFDPYVIVIPDISRGRDYMLENLQKSFEALNAAYPSRVICGYDAGWDRYLEIEDEYELVFFSNPYGNMVQYCHRINYFLDRKVLTLYADYGFPAVKFARRVFNTDFYNYVWKVFTDSKINYHNLCLFQPIHGRNAFISGYIKMDKLANATINLRNRKKILICPHHTVMGWNALDISNFSKYSELFIRLPKQYPDIDFVFRPHPLLFINLKNKQIWTESQIKDYMDRLLDSPNMTYDNSGDYFELFANSDGMIHDCGSYIGEYLFTEKPCCYMLKDEKQINKVYSKMGKLCLSNYYKAFNESDIFNFIENVIINGKDELADNRKAFARTVLKLYYPNGASRAINYILTQIKGKEEDEL